MKIKENNVEHSSVKKNENTYKQYLKIFFLFFIGISALFYGNFVAVSYGAQGTPADQYHKRALTFYQQGQFEQAILSEIEAVRLYSKDGKSKEKVEALIQLSKAYLSLGRNDNAQENLQIALSVAETIGTRTQIASVLCNLGNIYISMGKVNASEEYLNKALVMAREEHDSGVEAAILNNLGNSYTLQKKYRKAIGFYKKSIVIANKTDNPSLAARVSANAATALLQTGDYKKAEKRLGSALEKYIGLNHSHDKAYGLINIGQTYRQMSMNVPDSAHSLKQIAYKALSKAVAVAETIDDLRANSYALGFLGQFYEDEHCYQESLDFTRRAIFAAQQTDSPESLYLWQWQLGRLFRAQDKIDKAISAYRNALQTLQSVREDVFIECRTYKKLSFQKSVKPVYFDLAELLLERTASLKEPKKIQSYLMEARKTIERMRTAEIQDYFQDPCVDAYQSKITRLDAISKNTAVVYFILFAEHLELLVSLPDGMNRFSVPVGADTLTKEVRLLRGKLENRSRTYLAHSQKLYDWLIRPVEAELASQKIGTLIFVPDGALRSIPMAALHDGRQFLIKKFAGVTTQGLTLTDPHPIKREKIEILLSGLTESVREFSPLPHVSTELQGIKDLYGGTLLKNQDFVISSVKEELKLTPYSIVHIASHGEFAGDVRDTFILTWDDKLTMDHLDQFIKFSRFRKDPVELLTLSACQTAAGDDRAALGLAGVGVKAGARSALATLWHIDDKVSSELIVEFYRQLQDTSVTKAKALQQAQLKIINQNTYQHPYFWSPFLLIGNWL